MALDFIRTDGGETNGSPVLASAAGTADQRYEEDGAGNYIVIDQGDTVTAEGYTDNWWSKLRDQRGFVSNIYIDHPDPQLPGVPTC